MEEIKKEDAKTLCFTLSNEIRYTNADGSFVNTKELVLYSPCNVDQPTARHLRQMIINSHAKEQMNAAILASNMAGAEKFAEKVEQVQRQNRENPEGKEDATPITSEVILLLIYQQDSALLESFYKKLRYLMCTQCCRLDGNMNMKQTVYDQISYNDKDKLAGAYCAFFLPPSF